jgi:RimJ/RimL family protein N-acetyltransferase
LSQGISGDSAQTVEADVIAEFVNAAALTIRSAGLEDSQRLFEWRNDPLTRQMSKDNDPVTWGSHLAWMNERLTLAKPHIYIVELDGVPVATYRLDGENTISYTVAPQYRSRGIATALLVSARERHGTLTAEIFHDNVVSIKAAKRAQVSIVYLKRP